MKIVGNLTDDQDTYKSAREIWSVNENLEHLVLAEVSGVSKIWSDAEGVRKGKPVWMGEHTNSGRPKHATDHAACPASKH